MCHNGQEFSPLDCYLSLTSSVGAIQGRRKESDKRNQELVKIAMALAAAEDPFPKAPPPSPVLQQHSHSGLFEIPASKFEGVGGRGLFDTLSDGAEEGVALCNKDISVIVPNEQGFPQWDSEEQNRTLVSIPCSPQKRLCCSPSDISSPFSSPIVTTTTFPSSTNHSPFSNSNYQMTTLPNSIPEEGYSGLIPASGSPQSHSNSSPYQTNFIPSPGDTTTNNHSNHIQATPILHPPPHTSPNNTHLSRSFDLYSAHPHLPVSFETTQLPEVRPTRSRTLDSASPPHEVSRPRSHTLDASYGEDPSQRKRKVSIKRKNPEELEMEDGSLQFSFEYSSYSSVGSGGGGSGGESDWVMVDCLKQETSLPMGKKACCDDNSTFSAPISLQKDTVVHSSLSTGNDRGTVAAIRGRNSIGGYTSSSPSQFPPPSVGVPWGNNLTTPTQIHGSTIVTAADVQNAEMMECEGRLDSLDLMDCDDDANAASSTGGVSRGVVTNHLTTAMIEQAPSDLVMRYLRPGGGGVFGGQHQQNQSFLRHSCVEQGEEGYFAVGGRLQADQEAYLSLSKSL